MDSKKINMPFYIIHLEKKDTSERKEDIEYNNIEEKNKEEKEEEKEEESLEKKGYYEFGIHSKPNY